MPSPSFTLTSGPTMMSDRVLAALGSQTTYDGDPVFLERFIALERKLAGLLQTRNDIVLMQGEAVLVLEAAARGLTGPGTRWLNLVSGPYADWFGDWLRSAGGEVVTYAVPYDEAIDPAEVERLLREDGGIDAVAVVHCETPSGMTNPLEEIAAAAREHGALVLGDTVATFASSPLPVDAWDLDVCVVAPHKCLGATPGVSIVSVSSAAWERMAANPSAPRGSFLSLLDWKTRWIDAGRTHLLHAASVSEVVALDTAVDELIELGGVEASIARHRRAGAATRAGVKALGLELWARDERHAADCTTAVRCPAGLTPSAVVAHVRERQDVMLSLGRGVLEDEIICLGHMGIAARAPYPQIAVTALGQGLADLGVSVDVGAGAAAVAALMAGEGGASC